MSLSFVGAATPSAVRRRRTPSGLSITQVVIGAAVPLILRRRRALSQPFDSSQPTPPLSGRSDASTYWLYVIAGGFYTVSPNEDLLTVTPSAGSPLSFLLTPRLYQVSFPPGLPKPLIVPR